MLPAYIDVITWIFKYIPMYSTILIYVMQISSVMAKLKALLSAVSLASQSSNSLKTTIPIFIASQMELVPKDHLEWRLDKVDDEWVATLKKVNDG